jgi:hypothetical protein
MEAGTCSQAGIRARSYTQLELYLVGTNLQYRLDVVQPSRQGVRKSRGKSWRSRHVYWEKGKWKALRTHHSQPLALQNNPTLSS